MFENFDENGDGKVCSLLCLFPQRVAFIFTLMLPDSFLPKKSVGVEDHLRYTRGKDKCEPCWQSR